MRRGKRGVVKGRGCLEDYVGREGLWIKGGELEERGGKGRGIVCSKEGRVKEEEGGREGGKSRWEGRRRNGCREEMWKGRREEEGREEGGSKDKRNNK